MSSIIRCFNIFREFPLNIQQNIKLFYVNANNVGYCVTNDDKVYGLGENIHKILGFNEYNDDIYVLIIELCDQNILDFIEGYDCMFARNDQNHIFCWTKNCAGQLDELSKPKKIKYLDNKNIIHISCGKYYCFALSSDGLVYGWESATDKHYLASIISLKPLYHININRVLDQDQFDSLNLYAINHKGVIYKFWKNQLKFERELFSDLSEINKLIGDQESNVENKITDLCIDCHKVICETKNSIFVYDISKEEIQKTSYKSLYEYFLYEKKKTYKTIHIKNNKLFVINFEKPDENCEILVPTLKQFYYSFRQSDEISLRSFKLSNLNLSQSIESNVKSFYQSMSFGMFVMNDNKVYSIGYNTHGKLGLASQRHVYDDTLIPELCDQNIEEFYEGSECMFARNDQNHIFSWGRNHKGQLGRGDKSSFSQYLKPQKIQYFSDKNIVHIICGYYHCLALSSEGLVFGWGANDKGQIGCGKDIQLILSPTQIDLKSKIKFIYSTRNICLAVTFKGKAYYWGEIIDEDMEQNCQFVPRSIEVKNVSKMINYYNQESKIYVNIILDDEGNLFKYNINRRKKKEIKCDAKFIDIYCDNDYCLLQSEDCVYLLRKSDEIVIKTNFLNFYDFYSQKSLNYEKTIHITKDGYLMTTYLQLINEDLFMKRKDKKGIKILFNNLINRLKTSENESIDEENFETDGKITENDKQLIVIENKNLFENKFQKSFKIIEEIGQGLFGKVYKVEKLSTRDCYAIKKVKVKDELNLNETQILSQINSVFIVHYFDSWIEMKVKHKKIKKLLYIKMELCSYNLRDILTLMKGNEPRFLRFNFFISCELFRELTECVNYLHSLNPPIIHRDLKPENILITDGNNQRFLKICDFGLAKVHEISLHSRMVGTYSYMAPEIKYSRKYNTKSDIYSLALIATEIFGFEDGVTSIRDQTDFNKYLSRYLNTTLEVNFRKLLETLLICLQTEDYNSRFNCEELLVKINEFSIEKNNLLTDEKLKQFKTSLVKQDNLIIDDRYLFLMKFIQTKLC